jgi:hypothetical protein
LKANGLNSAMIEGGRQCHQLASQATLSAGKQLHNRYYSRHMARPVWSRRLRSQASR